METSDHYKHILGLRSGFQTGVKWHPGLKLRHPQPTDTDNNNNWSCVAFKSAFPADNFWRGCSK